MKLSFKACPVTNTFEATEENVDIEGFELRSDSERLDSEC